MTQYNAEAGHRGDHARCGPCDIVLNDMTDWLHDCEINTTDATAYGITAMVERTYDGGIDQFLRDGRILTHLGQVKRGHTLA